MSQTAEEQQERDDPVRFEDALHSRVRLEDFHLVVEEGGAR